MAAVKEHPILFSGPMVRALLADKKTQTRRVVKPQPDLLNAFKNRGFKKCQWVLRSGKNPISWDAEGPCPYSGDFLGAFSPYGLPGDRLWGRETFGILNQYGNLTGFPLFEYTNYDGNDFHESVKGDCKLVFQADGKDYPKEPCSSKKWAGAWRPSIHMPRWTSRILLENTDVRVERVADISEADAIAEGLTCLTKDDGRTWKYGIPEADGLPGPDGWVWREWHTDPRQAYRKLWNSINAHWRYEKKLDRWTCYPWAESDIPPLPKNADPAKAMACPNPWVWVIGTRRVAA